LGAARVDFTKIKPLKKRPATKWLYYRSRNETEHFYLGRALWENDRLVTGLQVPHWFLFLPAASLAALPWFSCFGWRFRLRTLLIAITLVAVVLGLIVWLVIK
jgi:hypothetical protein